MRQSIFKCNLLYTKKAVVTGGASGIGRQIAIRLAEHGAVVAIIDSNRKKANSTVDYINENIGRSFALICDITDKKKLEQCFEKLAVKFRNSFDIFVNNAGINLPCRIEDLKTDGVQNLKQMINVNQVAAYLCASYSYPLLIRGKEPCMIIIGSCASKGSEGQGGYAGTKAALRGLMATLVKEWRATDQHQPVRVNLIEPDYIEQTDLRSTNYLKALAQSRRISLDKVSNTSVVKTKVPVRREGTLDEVAQAVIYLIKAGYVNGNNLILSGGKTIRI